MALSVGSFGFYYRYLAGTQTNTRICRNISAVTDGEAESPENFLVVLADPISGVIGSLSTTTINIANAGKLVFVANFGLVANRMHAICKQSKLNFGNLNPIHFQILLVHKLKRLRITALEFKPGVGNLQLRSLMRLFPPYIAA